MLANQDVKWIQCRKKNEEYEQVENIFGTLVKMEINKKSCIKQKDQFIRKNSNSVQSDHSHGAIIKLDDDTQEDVISSTQFSHNLNDIPSTINNYTPKEKLFSILQDYEFLQEDDFLIFYSKLNFVDLSLTDALNWLDEELTFLTKIKNKYDCYPYAKRRFLWFLQLISAKRFLGKSVSDRKTWYLIKSVTYFKRLFKDFNSNQLHSAYVKKIRDDFYIEDYERRPFMKKDEMVELANFNRRVTNRVAGRKRRMVEYKNINNLER